MSDSDPSALSSVPAPVPASDEPIFRLPPVVIHPTPSDAEIKADPWHISKTRIADAREKFKVYGAGVKVAIGDTGFDRVHCETGQLVGKVASHRDFTGSGQWDGHGHGCIAPDDVVYTSMCGLQSIKEVFDRAPGVAHFMEDGALIKDVTRFGINTIGFSDGKSSRMQIQYVHKLRHKGKVFRVTTQDHAVLTLTPWHPVYIQTSSRGAERTVRQRRADALEVGDRIVVSGPSNGVTDSCLMVPIGANMVPLDEDLAYLAGLVMSDGHVMKQQWGIDFCNNDARIVEQFESLCLAFFGKLPAKMKPRPKQPKSIGRRLDGKDAALCMMAIGIPRGKKSLTKTFPELVAKSPLSVIGAFLAGYIDGNGHMGDKPRIITGSKAFAFKIRDLLRTLGYKSSVGEAPAGKTGYKSDGVSYQVRIPMADWLVKQLRIKQFRVDADEASPRKISSITSVECVDYDGDMYDFTVFGAHNYVANGCIVSNSHVGGLVLSMAPQAKLVNSKCLNNQGAGDDRWIAQSIRHAVDEGCCVYNGSYGSSQPGQHSLPALKYANDNGCICVMAGGNTGQSNDVQWPARSEWCISASPIDENDLLAVFGSIGPEIDVAWYGVMMLSLGRNGGHAVMSGSSMTSPIVAGLLALRIEWEILNGGRQTKNVADAGLWLAKCCRDAGEPGRDPAFGYGIPDAMLAFGTPDVTPVNPPSDAKIITRNVWINGEPYTEITSTNYEKRVVATTP